jgi:hypothetical protein
MKNNKQNINKNKNNNARNANSSIVRYRGGIDLFDSRLQNDTTIAKLVYKGNQTSTSGGVIAGVFSTNLSQFNNYTNYSNGYDEWRILEARFRYIPLAEDAPVYLSSSTNAVPGVQLGVVDLDTSNALISLTSFEYASSVLKSLTKPLTLIYKMRDTGEAQFINSTSASTLWFKTYADTLSASVQYGNVFIDALFQFRGRQ